MLKPLLGIAILLTLAPAAAQTPAAPAEPAAPGQVVKITGSKSTPTGESAKVYAAKRRVLRGTLAQKCALDSVYFSQQDDEETYIEQLEQMQEPGEISETGTPMPSATLQKFNPNAPYGDASNAVDSSSITGAASSNKVGPCEVGDRRFASGRERIIRNDKSFARALEHLDAKEYDKAAVQLEAAYSKIGYPEAAVLLAKLSLDGLGVPRSTDKALYWLDRAAGQRFDARKDALRFNPKEPEALNGMIEAALLLARIHQHGIGGVRKDQAAARKWYAKAADFGFVPALNTLGLASQAGAGGPRDLKQARGYFQKAAEEGYVPAQFNLARLYYAGGEGVAQDYAQAGAWFAEAGKSGHARSLYAMARMYDLGEGVQADQSKAIVYYKEAALKLLPEAQGALATYFYTGEQVPKNVATARQLFNEAAMGGDSEAMFNLAAMLAGGEGGDKDLGMAYAWLSLAKASGLERAGPALGQIEPKLSAQDRARADAVLKPSVGKK
ncbi:SEL1-like repeat protein [Massilia varians]|uniref:SEL1-like repeat protein n=1 Tax=Massilia varians TaxID=457921 RepID=UPI0025555DCE|nr:SEL1-like repeat protein [Massilia varians]MDK6078245.1 SEL1-like repeat protein [Massilia varians]